jgi:hypothetical protein
MLTTRRGTSLVEVIVAMTLSVVVIAGFARAIMAQRRAERTIAGAYQPGVAADEAVRVAAALLSRAAASDSLWVRGDSALEWRATVGVSLACFAGGDSVVVPDVAPSTWWEAPPDTGDAADVALAAGQWTSRSIAAIRTRASGGACGGPQRTLQLGTAVAWGATLPAVRVTRRTRLMLYRDGDGAWWLGERRCADSVPAACGAAQPIAGPLAPPPAGLRFAIDSSGPRRVIVILAAAATARRGEIVALLP